MFYYLSGTTAALEAGLAVLDCGGVGFMVNTTTATQARLRVGEQAKLYTHCVIREDAFDIYGFFSRRELETFRLLISVNGVGPKVALGILSYVDPDGLHMAVVTQNEKALTAAPGVGKKLAQRILLELKDKMGAVTLDAPAGAAAPVMGPGGKAAEAMEALGVLGYDGSTIQRAMKGIDVEAMELQDIIKAALKAISAQ